MNTAGEHFIASRVPASPQTQLTKLQSLQLIALQLKDLLSKEEGSLGSGCMAKGFCGKALGKLWKSHSWADRLRLATAAFRYGFELQEL